MAGQIKSIPEVCAALRYAETISCHHCYGSGVLTESPEIVPCDVCSGSGHSGVNLSSVADLIEAVHNEQTLNNGSAAQMLSTSGMIARKDAYDRKVKALEKLTKEKGEE